MFRRLRSDIQCILDRDPAARGTWEVVTCYPGLHALVLHRVAHWCWAHRLRWPARFLSLVARWLTGIEIHPAARIGDGVFIDHGMGVVIGETAEVGDGCTIYQGVTLGGTSLTRGAKRHPTLGRNVVVGAGAKVLGGFTVGDGAAIGSNAVVTKPVPAGATAVGIPARIILAEDRVPRTAETSGFRAYGVTQADDPVSQAMRGLIDSAASQEHQIAQLWQAIERLTVAQRGRAADLDLPNGEREQPRAGTLAS
jgi:serine O-acetyltransferase